MSDLICARCYARVASAGDQTVCPRCGAEAGLEAGHAPSGPMIMLAALIVSAVLITLSSSLLSVGAG